MKASKFFSRKQQAIIVEAIQNAETLTSGEIRIHLENYCNNEILDRTKELFVDLGMDNTELKNGVLIYIAVRDKKFAIIGDEGIDQVTPDNYWDDEVKSLSDYFKVKRFTEGLVNTISNIGEKLKAHFPCQPNDINELSDEISVYDN